MDVRTLELKRRVEGAENPDTLGTAANLAAVYAAQGRYDQANRLYVDTLAAQRRVPGPLHPDTLLTMSYIATMYQRQGRFAQAASYAAQVLEGRRQTLGPEHPDTSAAGAELALAWVSEGKFEASERLARQIATTYQEKQSDDWQRYEAESVLGASLAGQKKFAAAEEPLLDGYRGMKERENRMAAADRYHVTLARDWIVQLYTKWQKPEKAAEFRRE